MEGRKSVEVERLDRNFGITYGHVGPGSEFIKAMLRPF